MSTIDEVVPVTKSEKASRAKQTLKDFVQEIDVELAKYFNNEISRPFSVSKKEAALSKAIWKHIKEHNLRPAKRLRGSFVYYGYQMLGGKKLKEARKVAMSIELIHTALLMHDDFMDQDDTRRGKPTTHEYFAKIHKKNKYVHPAKHYGESMAVTVGDIALLAGHKLITDSKFKEKAKLEAVNRTFQGIVNTGIGQAYDVTLESIGKATEKDIIDLHHAKTALYTYENPLHVGAILAGAKEKDLKLLSRYAIPGGIAFQLQDDILGLYGDPVETGKPAHSDLRQGKMTLLIIKALEKGTNKQVSELKKVWGNPNVTDKDAQVARKIVEDTGSLEYSRKVSRKWAQKAQLIIPSMISKGYDKKGVDYLDGIAQYMVERKV